MGQLAEFAGLFTTPAFVNGFVAVSFKAAVVLMAALASTALLRRAPASTRHQVWTLALAAVLALPALSLTLPAWQVAMLPQAPLPTSSPSLPGAAPSTVENQATTADAEIRSEAGVVERAEDTSETGLATSPGAAPRLPGDAASSNVPAERATALATFETARQLVAGAGLGTLLLIGWAIPFTYLLARLAASTLGAWWLVRGAEPVTDASLRAEAAAVGRDLGMTANVRLVRSDRISMPMAWGVLRPTVLLPRAALDWSADRRRVVLLHEMAHLQRRDCLTLILARLVTALHWFNPLSWTAARRLQAERERACDDLVLSSGTAGADYAQHLLDIARAMRRDGSPAWATVAMARPSELEGRLLAILEPSRERSRAPRATGAIALLAIGALVLPLAALHPSAVAQEPRGQEQMSEAEYRLMVKRALALELAPELELDLELKPKLSTALEVELPTSFDLDADLAIGAADGLAEGVANRMATGLAEDIVSDMAGRVGEGVESGFELEGQDSAAQSAAPNQRVLQAFAAALQDEDASIRAQAANALGSMESEAAVEMLTTALRNDSDARVRSQAAWALGMIESDAAVPALAEAMAGDEDRVRKQAVWALGMIEAEEAVQPLVAALGDEDAGIRAQAAWALGMIESPEAVTGLVSALGDAEARVRSQAAWALGMIEDAGGVTGLSSTLRNDDSTQVRKQAAWALGMIESEDGLDALLDAITDEDLEVRKTALWAVGQISG